MPFARASRGSREARMADEQPQPQPAQHSPPPASTAAAAADGSSVAPPAGDASEQPQAQPVELPAFTGGGGTGEPAAIELLSDVTLQVKIELGRTRMLVEDVLRLADGAVVELDKLAGDPVDVYVNERHVARGEVLVLNDNFCVRINEILESPVDGKQVAKKAG